MTYMNSEVYGEFEAIVGEANICNDPAIMPAYHGVDFAAVILPKDTAEVQAIVRLCNKHKLKFVPICTGWLGHFDPGTVLLDLRRMNHLIEINEKSMYAVVEPYVLSGPFHAELMKRGLNFNMKGAGCTCTALLRGHGHMDESTSCDDRNHLALEWVTPEGEIVRIGSLGSSGEWFCGDGPGPSLRSVINSAPIGITPGVFTKAAIKLYHWPGPNAFPLVGKSPKYTLSENPPYMMARYFSFPSHEKMWQAELSIGESELALVQMGFHISMVASNITSSNEEEEEVLTEMEKEAIGPGFFVVIAGNSAGDFKYKKKVLEEIVKEAGGVSLSKVEEPEVEGLMIAQCTRITGSIRETSRAGGAAWTIQVMGQRDLTLRWATGASEAKKEFIKQGKVIDDGGAFFGWGAEQGHLGKTEMFCRYNPLDPLAYEAVGQFVHEQSDRAYRENFFGNTYLEDDNLPKLQPKMMEFFSLWREFREVVDPNSVTPEWGFFSPL
jgi:glycolate oxidase